MKVRELMTREVATCLRDEDMNCAARIMWECDCGIVPVVDAERRVLGVITDRDVCMAAYTMGGALASLRIGDAMAKEVFSCSTEDTVEKALLTMRQTRVRRLPVVDGSGKLVGIVSINDVARAAALEHEARVPSLAKDLVEALATISEPRKECPIEPPPAVKPRAARASLAGAGA